LLKPSTHTTEECRPAEAATAAACRHKERQRALFGAVILIFVFVLVFIAFAHLTGDAEAKQTAAAAAAPHESHLSKAALPIGVFKVMHIRCLRHIRFLSERDELE
jgi:hypothetical protein